MAKAKHAEVADTGVSEDDWKAAGFTEVSHNDQDEGTVITGAVAEEDGSTSVTRRHRTPEEFRQEYGYYLKDETKSQKFTRVAARRVSAVIDALRTLPQLGAKQTYECTEEQATKMWDAIHEEFKKNVAEFERVQVGGYSAREKSFTF